MKKFQRLLIIAVFVLVATIYGSAPLLLPVPQPETAPTREFSAERAFQHVAVISKESHPVGSEAMAAVAAYLLQTLQADGLQAEIQAADGYSQWMNKTFALKNVVARIPGNDSSGAVLIVAHPDSTPYGPGAGDNASGAATLLEVARAIKAGAPLKNDIIVLFDDGEEFGYLGGFAFVREHPWMADVRFVIGIDQAAWGPSVLLQAIPPNVQGYARAVHQPVAFGLYYDMDWTLGHDDSLVFPFIKENIPALDFEDPTAVAFKHSDADTVDKVKQGSMQQMGDQVLAVARQYGDMDLNQTPTVQESFFALWGLGLVHYPAALNLALAIVTLIGFGFLVGTGLRQKILGKGFILGSLLNFGLVLLSAILGLAAGKLFGILFPKPQPYIQQYLVPASLPFLIVSLAMVAFIYARGRAALVRRTGENPGLASLLPWIGWSLVAAILIPVGSAVFVLPAMLGLISWEIVAFKRLEHGSAARTILLTLPLAAGIILFTPNLILIFISTGLDNLWLIVMALVLLLDLGIAAVE